MFYPGVSLQSSLHTLHSFLFCASAELLNWTLYHLQNTFNISLCIFPIPPLVTVMLSQTISLHTSPEHPVNFWFLSPSVTHMAETPSFDTLLWMLLSNKISHTLLHTITGRLLNCIAWSFFTIHIAIFFEETCPLASPPFYKSILPLLQNCSDSKVWVLLQVIKIVPVLITPVSVLAIHLDLYGFT